MLSICDARFQDDLVAQAKAAGKLHQEFVVPEAWRENRPEVVSDKLKKFRSDGLLPDYPLGSDFTEVEERLVKALAWLKRHTATTPRRARTLLQALLWAHSNDDEAMARMALETPVGLQQRLMARLLALALRETGHAPERMPTSP